MSKFLDYVNDMLLVESVIGDVDSNELNETYEVLCEAEEQLNEFLKLGKLADKLKSLSDKGDKKVEDVKKGAKELKSDIKAAASSAGDAIVNATKETVKKGLTDAKEVGKSFGEIGKVTKDTVKEKFVQVTGQAREALKKMFKGVASASDDQKKVLADLAPLFEKIEGGKSVGGADAIKILSAIMSMDASGQTPSYKAYQKQLERLRTTPMLSSFRFSVKKS